MKEASDVKRLYMVLMACVLLFPLFACGKSTTPSESAKQLIEEGKLTEAYAVLYSADKNDTEAKEMLSSFKSLPTVVTRTTYTMYNGVCEKTFNEYGDVTKEARTETYNGYPNNYVCDTAYTYDSDGRILTSKSTKDGDGIFETVCEYTYDANGNLTREFERQTEAGATSSFETLIEYKYDSANQMSELIASNNGEFWYRYEYTYDESGNKKSETLIDALAVTTDTYKYDSKGEITEKTTVRSDKDGNESTVTLEYTRNEHGDAVKTVTVYQNAPYAEMTSEYTYDDSGRITSEKNHNPIGTEQRKEYVYNERGDVIKQTSIDNTGRIVIENEIVYGKNGKTAFVKTTTNAFSAWTQSNEYDEYGNTVLIKTDKSETAFQYTYGSGGQILKKTEISSDGTSTHYEYTYNPDKTNAKTVSYRIGADGVTREAETELIYDSKGNLIEKNEKGSRITVNTYDEHNNILSVCVTDSSGGITEDKSYQYLYDASGNITEKTENGDSGTKRTVYTYTQDGQVSSLLMYNKSNTVFFGGEFVYDEKGNLTEKRVSGYKDGIKYQENVFSYTYDECCNCLTEVSGGDTVTVVSYSGYVCFYCPAE